MISFDVGEIDRLKISANIIVGIKKVLQHRERKSF
jgi:hypothetical protein